MNPATHFKSLRQTIIVAMIAISLAAGAAFALLQSQARLTGNTISTSSAHLLVSTDGTTYNQMVSGFNFTDLIPGGWPAPRDGYTIYLENTGSTDLDLSLAVDPTVSNPVPADLSKLSVSLTDPGAGTSPKNFTLASLVGKTVPLEGTLAPRAIRQYKLQALASDDAVAGATVSSINLVFAGIARDPNAPN